METERGVSRGSYIWGQSVNNTRIERLWYDVTHGFGFKWKTFFIDLTVNHGLDPAVPEHIWLLHHLFLDSINEVAPEWAEAWNRHDLQIRGERTRSPYNMFFFSQLQDGPCGLECMVAPQNEVVVDPSTYGIDWDVIDDSHLMHHHLMENPEEWADQNPFAPNVQVLSELAVAVDLTSHSMNVHKLVWKEAFAICNTFYQ
ncbi:hypothetical protein B0H14DRAFT_3089098 [Mycena olivaceomarginata]|nr:hypothetical protein B0H14DRAFT_3089098 [Mycena olivaceomarginata]